MRSQASTHIRNYRDVERWNYGHEFASPLNFNGLLNALQELNNDSDSQEAESSSGPKVGKKRQRETLTSDVPIKRLKLSDNQSESHAPRWKHDDNFIPVLSHQYELQYTKELNRSIRVKGPNEKSKEEEALLFIKEHFASTTTSTAIDFGEMMCEVGHRGARLRRREGALFGQSNSYIALIPPIPHDSDSVDEIGNNVFVWLLELWGHHYCRQSIHASLRMVVSPLSSWDEKLEELPFHLVVNVTLGFCLPDMFSSPRLHRGLDSLNSGNRRGIEAEARRKLLHFLFPPAPLPPALAPAYGGKIDIPFFYSCLQPAPRLDSKTSEDAAQPKSLIPSLLPFQKRSVIWMLSREGKTLDASGAVVDIPVQATDLPLTWERVVLSRESGKQLVSYYQRVTGALSMEMPEEDEVAHGGILAEEPGLGKTLECIALVMLNPGIGRNPSNSRWDPVAKIDVKEIRATLIVTPGSLSQQWKDEFALHSPSLKVLVYDGWTKVPVPITKPRAKVETPVPKVESKTKRRVTARTSKSKASSKNSNVIGEESDIKVDTAETPDWCSYVNTFDVVITTYNVLQQDLNVARAPPVRPRRGVAEYMKTERPRSPLVMVEWHRVIMDEVQMVGGGRIQEMVSLIPRSSSFAVSGTPARAHVSDLSHVLKFLRVNPEIYSPRIWARLTEPEHVTNFAALFQRYAVRTMKASVQDELTIPQQTRFLVPIELGKVERHVYDQHMERALLELGLDARGVAATENWQIDTTLLRTWLRKLRQICTHPQVGQLLKQGDKLNKPGALKSMEDVLENMRDQNWRNLMDDRRAKVNELARHAQLVQHDNAIDARYLRASQMLLQAEKEADQLMNDLKAAIAEHDAKGDDLKKEAALLKASRAPSSEDEVGSLDKGKGKALARDETPAFDEGSMDSDLPNTTIGEEHGIKRRALQQRVRECYIAMHRIKFLQGDVYHVMGDARTAEEDAAYSAAEGLRHKLLKITEEAAIRAMAQLAKDVSAKGLTKQDLLVPLPYCPKGGKRSADLLEEADEIIEERLNAQTELLWQWREHIYGLLTQNLTASESEADGQEYSRTIATQGEAETYLQAYAALMADRREVLLAERTALAAHDIKEKKLRKTRAAVKAAAALDDDFEIPDDIELQPEHEVLRRDLTDARKDLLEDMENRAVRSIVVELAGIAAKISRDDDPEKIMAKEGANALRRLISSQTAMNDKLEADIAQFRKAFNERIQYFRQLQEISDSVVEVEWEHTIDLAIEESRVTQQELDGKINTGRARQRYLDHLAQNQDDGNDEDDGACILCRCTFTRGYITQCAHIFCEDCIKSWITRQGGKACPVCRVGLDVDNLQRFSVQEKTQDNPASSMPDKSINKEAAPRSRRKIEYNTIREGHFEEVQSMEVTGSYGSKIETLVRHLLYLQLAEPGAKSIVFSAWADSLQIIEHALTMNGITCMRIDQVKGKQNAAKHFRTDPELLVLLLHGERENAGLNVTSASRVFLLESVVHHSFEIQAIARIDRMGQTRPTEVYCYYAEDTIEKNILDLAARQGLSLYTKDNSAGTLNVTALAPDAEKNVVEAPAKKKKTQKGDFIFKTDDMLAILFPHMYEEIEYLLPAWETEPAADADANADSQAQPAPASETSRAAQLRPRARHVNATAGPSRAA